MEFQDQCDSVAFLDFPEDRLKTVMGGDVSIEVERKGRRSDMAGRPWLSETGISPPKNGKRYTNAKVNFAMTNECEIICWS